MKSKDEYRITITFREDILGTVPKDPEIYRTYIQGKAAAENAPVTGAELEAELDTVQQAEEAGWTGFHADLSGPFLFNYHIKGFFKEACSMLRRVDGTRSAKPKLRAFKKIIDGLVFVKPRKIHLIMPDDGAMGTLERPLRASTPQGDRSALARSDTCPAGTSIEFTVHVLGVVTQADLREWLDYGAWRGLGQWRNADFGSFEYTFTKV